MDTMTILVSFLVGFLLGVLATQIMRREKEKVSYDNGKADGETERAILAERSAGLDRQLEETKSLVLRKETEVAAALNGNVELQKIVAEMQTRLEEERKASVEKLEAITHAEQKMSEAFRALSADALRTNNQSFLDLAKTQLETFHAVAKQDLEAKGAAISSLIEPIRGSLDKVDRTIQEIEAARNTAYGSLTEQIKSMSKSQLQLQSETANLVRALRTPNVRGRWGEMQLKRVVEMAGMIEHCDFLSQETVVTEGGALRPDMIIKLPNNRNVVVDSKVPLQAFLDAIAAEDDQVKTGKLKEHAKQVGTHVAKLSKKSYWDQLEPTPEFVVMFLPNESFFSAALEYDPMLIETGVNLKVIPATPTTLIALLKAVAYGWRQEQMAQNAQRISDLGKELYDRISSFANHFSEIGQGLERAIGSYNRAAGSFESRVLVGARRFKELGSTNAAEIEPMATIETTARSIQMNPSPNTN